MQLIVLGMHRSGTSGVTRVLNMAGAYFGPEGIATDANEENPKGFWERRDVREACDGLLHESGFDWWRVAGFSTDAIPDDVRARHVAELGRILTQLDAHRPWVVKEPRLCLLFPLLRPLLEVPVCIHVHREPLEVAGSVRARHGFPVQVGLALWELYTVRALEASAGVPRVAVRYEDLMTRPVATVGRFLEELAELGVQGLRIPTEQEVTAFLVPELHRAHATSDLRALHLNAWQAELAAAMDGSGALDAWTRTEVSEGALAALRAFEEDQDRSARLAELDAEVSALRVQQDEREQLHERQLAASADLAEEQLAASADLAEEQRRRADAAEHDADRLARRAKDQERRLRRAGDALRTIERRVRSLSRSRAWRLASKGMLLRQRMTPGMARKVQAPLDGVLAEVDTAQRTLAAGAAEDGEDPPPRVGGAERPVPALSSPGSGASPVRRSRPKIAVVAWDVGHNPLGRAHVLAGLLGRRFDVEIWGAQFERYGSEVWAPHRHSEIPIRVFEGRSFPEHLAVMQRAASEIDADAVYVSKPRFPSYGLGALAKQFRNRPLVLDVDDHELAFFDEDEGIDVTDALAMAGDDDLRLPFGRTWTRVCEPFVDAADALTVSNVALAARFGGVMVSHARDERTFDPSLYDRDETRRRIGVGTSVRLLLFGGTPRVHKGIVELLRALETLDDDRYRVLLFGTRELRSLRAEIGDLERWVIALPYQEFEDLPRLVGAADLACVLQDPHHAIAHYQLPAKVTDALAMGVPCLVNPTPPLQPLVDLGVVQVNDGRALHECIASAFEERDDAVDRARHGRKLFEEEYSYEAASEVVAPLFEELLDAPPSPFSSRLETMVEAPAQVFHSGLPEQQRSARAPRRRKAVPAGAQYDVVMFWKQNDTGIYGRRQDMFVKYLAQSDRVGSIVHFDSPTTPENLVRLYRRSKGHADQSRLIVRQTLRRLLRMGHADSVYRYTFLYGGEQTARLGLPPRRDYSDFVASVLERRGFGTRPTVFWVYPTNNDVPRLLDRLDPDLVVADVVDNHLTFTDEGSERYHTFERNYRDVLSRSDVVLANCEPVADAMLRFTPEVHVVPNGCELRNDHFDGSRPKELRDLVGPIIGYAGNLSQRLDLELIEALVREHPAWQFVFIGSAHYDRSILALESMPNVHILGVKPYEETRRYIQHFDVAMIPHLDDRMSRSMNPLKAFVYCSVGVPVVSTPVANLDELAHLITIARGAEAFGAAIEEALRAGRRPPDLDRLGPHSWEVRIERALDLVDQARAGIRGGR